MAILSTVAMSSLTVLALILGFVALLKQRTYLDTRDMRVTAVEVPFFGKLRTNYPALLFVFLGGIFGYLSYRSIGGYWTATKRITIDGQLKSSENIKDWTNTEITVVPSSILHQEVGPSGHFLIIMDIPRRKSYSQYISEINFQLGSMSGRIFPGGTNDTAKLEQSTGNLLHYSVSLAYPH